MRQTITPTIINLNKKKKSPYTLSGIRYIDYFPEDKNQYKNVSVCLSIPVLDELQTKATSNSRCIKGEIARRVIDSIEQEGC